MNEHPLLEVRSLVKHYPITSGPLNRQTGEVKAVDGISFQVQRGETLGLVGESGCGKSTAATTLLRLEEPTDGEILFDGTDISDYGPKELKQFRRRAQMIFQNPDSSLDPRMSIGEIVGEGLRVHGIRKRSIRREVVADVLERVGLSPEDADRYPHEFSGGQKQRIALARALVLNPDLIVADEPVSALDVSVQAEVLQLMREIQESFNLSMLLISHDIGVVREVCDRVAVMYLGEIVEVAPTEELFADPRHPYTQALLSTVPTPDPDDEYGSDISGDVPKPSDPPTGCRFHTRCPEIIMPEGLELNREEWLAVRDLRVKLANERLSREEVVEFTRAMFAVDNEETPSDDRLEYAVRTEYGIPERLSDDEAERVLSEGIEMLLSEGPEQAHQHLDSVFESICERDSPPEVTVTDQRRSACHLCTSRSEASE